MNFTLTRAKTVDSRGTPAKIGAISYMVDLPMGSGLNPGPHEFCDTLERIDKIIPAGTYSLIVSPMVSHGGVIRVQILVPERIGIFAHSGNWADQGEGCVLVGDSRTANDGELLGGLADHIADRFADLVEANPGSTLTVVEA